MLRWGMVYRMYDKMELGSESIWCSVQSCLPGSSMLECNMAAESSCMPRTSKVRNANTKLEADKQKQAQKQQETD